MTRRPQRAHQQVCIHSIPIHASYLITILALLVVLVPRRIRRRRHGPRRRRTTTDADINAWPTRVAARRMAQGEGFAGADEVDAGEPAGPASGEAEVRAAAAETLMTMSVDLTIIMCAHLVFDCAVYLFYTKCPSAAHCYPFRFGVISRKVLEIVNTVQLRYIAENGGIHRD